MEKRSENMRNDARQDGAGQPAFGQQAEDFGAGGQTTVNAEPRDPQRDVDRDPKVEQAGARALQARRSTKPAAPSRHSGERRRAGDR